MSIAPVKNHRVVSITLPNGVERRAHPAMSLFSQHKASAKPIDSRTLRFAGIGACDVYNITAPFTLNGNRFLAGRVEPRSTEISRIGFFQPDADGVWQLDAAAPMLEGLQDPCIAMVNGELVLGGVRFPIPLGDGSNTWRMEFYRGRDVQSLRRFLVGPNGMKDIRLAQLPDGRVVVFSRPQGEKGGKGKIGYLIVDSLDDLTAEMIYDAPLLKGQFHDGEWGGANEVHPLSNGHVGVLGHIAWKDQQDCRHYYPMAFALDPATGHHSPLKIIACRDDFPAGPAKRPDLVDVVFSGGLVRHGDGRATLYAGVSDAGAASTSIADPFVEYET